LSKRARSSQKKTGSTPNGLAVCRNQWGTPDRSIF
jgi:hypothetical protein